MRILAWNMNHWQTKARSDEAWRYVLDEVPPAIALLTEARPPGRLIDDGRVFFAEAEGRGDWGTAVYAADGLAIRHLAVAASHPGAFVAAEIDGPQLGAPITAISLYGIFERLLGTEYSSTTLHRSLSDLTGLLDDPKRRGRIILGGDLNALAGEMGKDAPHPLRPDRELRLTVVPRLPRTTDANAPEGADRLHLLERRALPALAWLRRRCWRPERPPRRRGRPGV
jgi:hypothetical protein